MIESFHTTLESQFFFERMYESTVSPTMTEVLIAFAVACILGLMACARGLIVNNRTCRQRKRLIDAVYNSDNWRNLAGLLDVVDYDKHMKELFWGRNPWKLYPPELQRLIKQ